MLYFIPAWYQQSNWRENEQNWHARRMRTEFDDTVKHIQLFHRSKAYPFQIMLLSFAPNLRHFLHRQSVFHAPYWSCFDAIQEVRRKKVSILSIHNLNWPEHIEFIYTPFVLVAQLNGEKYAQIEFGEDGNPIEIDMYKDNKLQRKNIYDDRGFVSSSIIYENEKPAYQDYFTDKGVWKIRHFFNNGHVEINPKHPTYLLEHNGAEYTKTFTKTSYDSMENVIYEVFSSYIALIDEKDIFCIAMHDLHMSMISSLLQDKKVILSYYSDRYSLDNHKEGIHMIESADYIITDSHENLIAIQERTKKQLNNIIDITPFDSRVDFGISQQLNVQKILVPIDGISDEVFSNLVCELAKYLNTNENARVHLFTRIADYDRKKKLLEQTRSYLKKAGIDEDLAREENTSTVAENAVDATETVPVKFFVEQCVSELSVSKCMREQRIMVDMRQNAELYLRITGISVGIPQIVAKDTPFVQHGKNGRLLKDMEQLSETLTYYLDNLTNWNEAVVYSYELGKKYTTDVLIDKWKEVIDFVGSN